MPEITKIVITGGPCGGKSTAMSKIQEAFTEKGYRVLFVPETATELITGGVTPTACGSNTVFQQCLLRLQLEKEAVYEAAAATMDAERVLIVCDRGALDNKAYMQPEEFAETLAAMGANEPQLRDGYDGVFHLVTAAKGAVAFYTTANNAARTETPEEAAEKDDRLIAAWTGHPHLRVIGNEGDFADKMRRLIAEIAAFLGEPEPYEIERKFLIDYPDVAWLESAPNCQRIEITQTYLCAGPKEEVRLRRRGIDGHYTYYKTVKRTVSARKRVEVEKRLSREDYCSLLALADPTKRPIVKTRYCLTYAGQYLAIDLFPFWEDKAIAEVELSNEEAPVVLPPQLRIIKEVTEDAAYKNATLAQI